MKLNKKDDNEDIELRMTLEESEIDVVGESPPHPVKGLPIPLIRTSSDSSSEDEDDKKVGRTKEGSDSSIPDLENFSFTIKRRNRSKVTPGSLEDSRRVKNNNMDEVSLTSSNAEGSASSILLSSHSMNMGFYAINLGTKNGQKLHGIHMFILPLIPVLILLGQNTANYLTYSKQIQEIGSVKSQVANALDMSELVQKLQDERAAVALSIFIRRQDDLNYLDDLKQFSNNVTGFDISRYSLVHTFNATDTMLQSVKHWPVISWVDFFETKLKFQIQHSIFRSKIREGSKTIFEVINWYNEINSFILDYISISIHDSDVSDFYRYIISLKNLLRSVEYAGKAGIYGLRYLSQGFLKREHHNNFIRNNRLSHEYLSQSFNFMPELKKTYDGNARNRYFESLQKDITYRSVAIDSNKTLEITIKYFSELLQYQAQTTKIVDNVAIIIGQFVDLEFNKYSSSKTLPSALIIILVIFIPLVGYFTIVASSSMIKWSKLYEYQSEIYKSEKRKSEKILMDLLPLSIIYDMKKGKTPIPENFECVTVFLCDIVGFTNLAAESTAHQIIEFLNSLYVLFDSRLEKYDVYKVETIGDAYLVASGIPIPNNHHASEIAKMGLDMLTKVVTFETQHKPGYRLKVRMGIHSGNVVGGVVGNKIPHYSIFGETVDIAGLMESNGQPMKIQITEATKTLLDHDNMFHIIPRGTLNLSSFGQIKTYWLLGHSNLNIFQ